MTGQLRGRGERGRAPGQPAEEQVSRNVGSPHRLLQHRPAVVGAEVGLRHHLLLAAAAALLLAAAAAGADLHARPVTPTATAATAMPAAARAAWRHMRGRSRVVTTGSGGRPYTSGWSSSRKKAPAPPMPSSGSAK